MASKIQTDFKLDATTRPESAQKAAKWCGNSEKTIFPHIIVLEIPCKNNSLGAQELPKISCLKFRNLKMLVGLNGLYVNTW